MEYRSWIKLVIYFFCVFFMFAVHIWVIDIKYTKLKNSIIRDFPMVVPLSSGTINRINHTKEMYYILTWTSPTTVPFVYLDEGQEVFLTRSCKYTNCYVTHNKSYLSNITQFHVIAFHQPEIEWRNVHFPVVRSPAQKYVFAGIESSHNYSMWSNNFDDYFNWTWTYKLDSDTRWGYIIVRDTDGNVIGPNKIMNWIKTEDMEPIPNKLRAILARKRKAAAWFVSNCFPRSNRAEFARKLQEELMKYSLTIDVYGRCGTFKCQEFCDKLVEKHYFFYLAFENALSEDYVTEKILHGLRYSTVPIVFGGANYTRFMPDGSYLNARELGVEQLAAKMYHLIHNFEEYTTYFKWRNHYRYYQRSASPETDDYCGICALINDEKKRKQKSVRSNLKDWWNN